MRRWHRNGVRVSRGGGVSTRPRPSRTATVLDRVRLEVDADNVALVASVTGPDLDETEVRQRVHAPELAANVDGSATSLVPAMTVLSGRLGTDLVIDAPVDEVALENARRAAALIRDWWGWRTPHITVAAETPARGPVHGTGLWFSRGVDSTDTLLRALDGELVEHGQTVHLTHLLGLDLIDPPIAPRSAPEVWSDTADAAAVVGLPLVRLTTDLRRLLDPIVPWPEAHGAVLCGLGAFLGPLLGTVIISASDVGDAPPPYGSHPALDPLWSTSGTRIAHVGCDRQRSEKEARLAQEQWALDRLKVCWEVDTPRNCGRCTKCLITMTLLDVAGALDRCDRFDAPLSPDAVWAIAESPVPLPLFRDDSTLAEIVRVLPAEASDLRAAWIAVQRHVARQFDGVG